MENNSIVLGGHPTRRTVARGAAWSLPVVAIAAAAPMAAASAPEPSGASITAANLSGGLRGAKISLVDDNLDAIPYPEGSVITLTVTGTGTLSGVTTSNGAFSPAITNLVAGTYTIIPTPGATGFSFKGTLSGSLGLVATIKFGPGAGDSVTSPSVTI